jgi:hypothetical protein
VDDWTTVVPPADEVATTARLLLGMARDPRDVRTDGNGSEFRIPPYLADLYNTPPRPRRRTKKEGDE